MKNKRIIMGLSVFITPFVIESFIENTAQASTQYILNSNVKTYATAQNAEKQSNASSKTYGKGKYYIYKQHNGMINISKTPGKAGAWINPVAGKVSSASSTNKSAANNVSQATKVPFSNFVNNKTTKSQGANNPKTANNMYTLNNDVRVYSSATDAKNQKNSKSVYKQGKYFIYKEYNGMKNISKNSGKAGAWVNPIENKVTTEKSSSSVSTAKITETKVSSNNLRIGSAYTLAGTTNVYSNAADAKNFINTNNTYNQGSYYIYKVHNGMINISKTKGKVGAWINPLQNIAQTASSTEIKETAPTSEFIAGTAYSLNNKVNTYSNAADALNRRNAKSIKDVGYYSIYKEYNGMINITKTPGKVGVWINPADNIEKDPNKNKFTGYKEGQYYVLDKVANGWYNDGEGNFFYNNGVKYTGYAKDARGINYFDNGVYSNNVTVKTDLTKNDLGAPSINNFQYKNLLSKSNYTADELNQVIEKFGGASSKLYNQGQAFKDAEEKYGVNALYLLSHAALESAWGKTKIAQDKNNFFGIGAVDNSPYKSAKEFTNEAEGVLGGAEWITNRYLKSTSFPASGAYLGNKTEGMNKNYSTDATWGYKIADIMVRSNQLLGNKDK